MNLIRSSNRHNLFHEDDILSSLSPILRSELQMFNCQHLVRRVPLFQKLPGEVLMELVGALKAEIYLPHDVILWENTLGDTMYFIQRGTVEVLTASGRVLSQLFDGNFFGEMALLTNERRRVATVMATSRSEIYALHTSEFDRIVQMYPKVFDEILDVAMERAKRITTEPEEDMTSGEDTIRKKLVPEFRQSLYDTFRLNKNKIDLSGGSTQPQILKKPLPVQKTLDEVLKMRKKTWKE